MQCTQCEKSAIIGNPSRCKEHFIEEFESRVKETIDRFELLHPDQKIAIACSGGKDSLTVLHLLHKWYGDVTAILIDEGIADYREHSVRDLERVCKDLNVKILRGSYKEFTGYTLDEILKRKKMHACTVCGTFRRHLISLLSKPFDVLVTGHNADDECQTILMNFIKGNTNVFPRNGPKTGVGAVGFTQRVKPLYFCTEKEVMTYAWLHGLTGNFVECPNASEGYRWTIREAFNEYVGKHPDARKELLERFLKIKERFPQENVELPQCIHCGEPSSRETCKACEFLNIVTS